MKISVTTTRAGRVLDMLTSALDGLTDALEHMDCGTCSYCAPLREAIRLTKAQLAVAEKDYDMDMDGGAK